jgi:hypothetical protein
MAAAAAALACAAVPAHASPARDEPARPSCTIRLVFFDVTGIALTERMTAHWDYATEADPPAQAKIDTTQTATVDWHQDRSTLAQRRANRQTATFEELVGACRVPNYRQGRIHGKAQGMHYHVDGTWSAGAQTGTCTNDRTTTRSVTGLFIRHSVKTDPPARTVGLKWTMSGPTEVDCPFTAFAPDDATYVPGHLRGYDLSYLAVERPIAKSTLFTKKVIAAPVSVHGDGHRRGDTLGLWNDGTLTTTLSLTGTITLTRYKSCSFKATDFHSSCPYPDRP